MALIRPEVGIYHGPRHWLIIALVGCATVPIAGIQKTPSHVIQHPEMTFLGRTLAPSIDRHAGKSGFLLMDKGSDALAWRAISADAAERTIDAQYYLWKNDHVGKILSGRLIDAAERGVRVRLLIDGATVGSDPTYLALMNAHPNVHIRLYKPFGPKDSSHVLRWVDFLRDFKRLNRRMHNKLYVVDGSVAIIGGRNIGDEYFDFPSPYNFRDRDLLAVGPIVNLGSKVFDLYWNSPWAVPLDLDISHEPSSEEVQEYRKSLTAFAADPSNYPSGFYDNPQNIRDDLMDLQRELIWAKATMFYDLPEQTDESDQAERLSRVSKQLRETERHAKSEILFESAYLVLTPEDFGVLDRLRHDGVTVRMLTNSLASTNHTSAFSGYARQRRRLLRKGVELYEFRPDAESRKALLDTGSSRQQKTVFGLHAKSAVFDRERVFVGTFNLDPRSSHLDTENVLIVHSKKLAQQIVDSFEGDMQGRNSWRLVLNDDDKLKWVGDNGGVENVHSGSEPKASFSRRFMLFWFKLIPADSQL